MSATSWTGATMVTLISGELVFSDAEAWRHETECRQILRMPLDARREHLFDLERIRGVEAVSKIRETMTALFEKARAA